MKTIVITGGNGYVGRHLVKYFSEKADKVYALQRRIPAQETEGNVTFIKYSIENGFDEELIIEADAFLHCALVDHTFNKNSDQLNLDALKTIISFCRKRDTKLVYFSTMSAHEEAESHYGRHKLAAEKLCDARKDLVLKCGLVVGPDGGLFHNIRMTLSKMKMFPVFGNGHQPLQSVDIKELCKIVDIGIEKNISGVYAVGEEKEMQLEEMYRMISDHFQYKNKFFRVPLSPLLLITRTTETLKLKLPISTEGLLGMKRLKAFDTHEIRNKFGVEIRPFKENIQSYS